LTRPVWLASTSYTRVRAVAKDIGADLTREETLEIIGRLQEAEDKLGDIVYNWTVQEILDLRGRGSD